MQTDTPAIPNSTYPVSELVDTHQQDRRIFDVYSIYRLVLSLVLLISFYYRNPTSPLGAIDPSLFLQLCSAYALFNFATLLLPLLGIIHRYARWQYFATLIADIILLVMLSYTCGGVSSGMANLLLIPIAAGSMLFRIRLSTFFAAVASLAIGYSEFYLYLTIPDSPDNYVSAGMLGLLLFMTTLTLQYLVSRIRQKEIINLKALASIQSLQAINQQIIERMQTGIIVVDENDQVLDCNTSAKRLLGSNVKYPALPAVLKSQLTQWRSDHFFQAAPFRLADHTPELQASFATLHAEPDSSIVLIFLDDNSIMSSRAQHLKLMSLGRLTASIAHEIRNPLGAISHACQLLEEAPGANPEEHRLLDIINTHTQRINSIIQNILDLSRHRQELPEGIELQPWLEQFAVRLRNSYRQSITLNIQYLEDPGTIRFIAGQLDQLLTNLCDNGLRYSHAGSGEYRIDLRISLDEQTRQVCLDVIDQGVGVKEGDIEQIFEPFFTTESSGTGLGLFICKEICEANQARLFFRRTEDRQSCFRIVFSSHNRLIH